MKGEQTKLISQGSKKNPMKKEREPKRHHKWQHGVKMGICFADCLRKTEQIILRTNFFLWNPNKKTVYSTVGWEGVVLQVCCILCVHSISWGLILKGPLLKWAWYKTAVWLFFIIRWPGKQLQFSISMAQNIICILKKNHKTLNVSNKMPLAGD